MNERTKQIRIISESILRIYLFNGYYRFLHREWCVSGYAKVSVRVDDFRRYVQDLASGGVDLSGGLFARYLLILKIKANPWISLVRRSSLLAGQGISIDMGKPISLDQFYVSSYCKYPIDDDCEGARNNFGGLNEATSIVLGNHIFAPGFEQNLMSTLDNIASDKIITDSSSLYIGLSGHDAVY